MGQKRSFPDFDPYGGLSFCDRAFGLYASPNFLKPPTHSRGPLEGRLVFVIVFPQAFFQIKTEGLSHAMIFLYGRIMVLGELFNGLVRVGPQHPIRGGPTWVSW